MTFDDLTFAPKWSDAAVKVSPKMASSKGASATFDNGYGVSVITGWGAYGGESGLYELAVTHASEGLVYDTPVTDDVLGHLTPDEVTEVMAKVAALPPRNDGRGL